MTARTILITTAGCLIALSVMDLASVPWWAGLAILVCGNINAFAFARYG